MRYPNDIMAEGPNSDNLAAAAIQAHPVDRMQRATNSAPSSSSSSLDIDAIRRLYGSALAMRLTTERQLASNVGGRLPGLDAHPDSNVMLDTLTGGDLEIDFGDFLNLKMNRTHDVGSATAGGGGGGRTGNPVIVHHLMESKLGL